MMAPNAAAMERKRKLPARASARVEQVSKKRTATPPDNRSATPVAAPPAPVVEEPPAPVQTLPKSIQPGKPLPVVDELQSEDLSNKDFQSIQESGVAAESLARSRQKWTGEAIFEKYWTKPTKKKGVVIEEPNNPPKDTMTKMGPVTIFIEPHKIEAIMYGVKDPRAPPPSTKRPVMQYGPPNGVMPPPPMPGTASAPVSVPSTPNTARAQSPASQPAVATQPGTQPPISGVPTPEPAASGQPTKMEVDTTVPPPGRPLQLAPAANEAAPWPNAQPAHPNHPVGAAATLHQARPPPQPSFPDRPPPPPAAATTATASTNGPPQNTGAPRPPAPPQGPDPIIVMLAEKATEDAQLRDLMKRVAQGSAPKDELERFQAIIDQITSEAKRRGSVQGPSADRLIFQGRTVRYFADEVRTILDIVLASDPRQTSANLRPPAKSDPIVVELVKASLDDATTRDIVRRIADNRPLFADATDLKLILEKLKQRIGKDVDKNKDKASQAASQAASPVVSSTPKSNGVANGHAATNAAAPAPQQALRSKGPPPPPKPDISAVVLEFANGTGDRYLFPKFSIVESIQTADGPQMLVSFLIVRKGSLSEHGCDPALDYYQPVTLRIHAASPRLLDNLTRVVAPQAEVRRYMNHVIDNMTRAEYLLLAMRLPRPAGGDKEGSSEKETNGVEVVGQIQPQEGVLWTAKANAGSSATDGYKPVNQAAEEDSQYQKFISKITPMEVDES